MAWPEEGGALAGDWRWKLWLCFWLTLQTPHTYLLRGFAVWADYASVGLHATVSRDFLCAVPALIGRLDCACRIVWDCKSQGFKDNPPSLLGDSCRGGSFQGQAMHVNEDSFFCRNEGHQKQHMCQQHICYKPASALCNSIINELKTVLLLLLLWGYKKQSKGFLCPLVYLFNKFVLSTSSVQSRETNWN